MNATCHSLLLVQADMPGKPAHLLAAHVAVHSLASGHSLACVLHQAPCHHASLRQEPAASPGCSSLRLQSATHNRVAVAHKTHSVFSNNTKSTDICNLDCVQLSRLVAAGASPPGRCMQVLRAPSQTAALQAACHLANRLQPPWPSPLHYSCGGGESAGGTR